MYVYLVVNKTNKNKYMMIGNLKNCNMGIGSGRYLYQFVNDDYKYAIETPYGLISNISCELKYNSEEYKVVHQIAV